MPTPLREMAWLESLLERLSAQGSPWWWLFAVSVVVLVVSPFVAAWLVVRLPSDYFVNPRRHRPAWQPKNYALRLAVVAGKNMLGVVLVVAGMIMLLTPGQGVLTVAVGLLLLDFPGKYRLQRWLITRKPVWRSINWLRRHAGRSEFERPEQRAEA
jgi:hypothetical protein